MFSGVEGVVGAEARSGGVGGGCQDWGRLPPILFVVQPVGAWLRPFSSSVALANTGLPPRVPQPWKLGEAGLFFTVLDTCP